MKLKIVNFEERNDLVAWASAHAFSPEVIDWFNKIHPGLNEVPPEILDEVQSILEDWECYLAVVNETLESCLVS